MIQSADAVGHIQSSIHLKSITEIRPALDEVPTGAELSAFNRLFSENIGKYFRGTD